jgi:O-antigen ligase
MQSVLRTGPTLWCLAHNEYLQTAAELGLIGLFFYVAILISFLFVAIRAWSRMPASSRRVFLAAAICAVVAQCVDALANPGWRFIDVDPILWLMLGLAMAAAPRGSEERQTEPGRVGPRANRAGTARL